MTTHHGEQDASARTSGMGRLESARLARSAARWAEHGRVGRLLEPALALVADRLVPPGRWADLLRGAPLGHAAHPALTDVPIGLGLAVAALDLTGGRAARPAARRLLGMAVLSSAPAALTGLAEWQRASDRDRRAGSVHAVANVGAVSLYAASWWARRRGHHTRGVASALLGSSLAGAGAWLGGHLAIARKVGSHDEQLDAAREGG
ncbi:MAG TPA: DUF2231 domain-containing protein [Oryzihumus sp.]|nr:DUF2231 domain-containing protein [Oryzihumus sp.]